MKKYTYIIYTIALISGWALFSSCNNSDNAAGQDDNPVRIGIAWRGDSTSISYTSALQSVREAGGVPVPLPLLKSPIMEYEGDQLLAQYTDEHGIVLQEYADKVKNNPFAGQDIASLLATLDGLVFTGGADISPTFYKTPEPWHGIEAEGNCDGRRDVSDYILMRWCLNQEPTADHGRDFAVHDITVTDPSSLLRQIVGSETVSRVPSWHHQAVLSVEGTPLKVTAVTKTSGIDIIEAVERTDKPFLIGLQYHPEVAVAKRANGAADASRFMDYDSALCYFRALIKQGAQKH